MLSITTGPDAEGRNRLENFSPPPGKMCWT